MPRIEFGRDKATGLSRDELLFRTLREARNKRLAETDFMIMPDYPMSVADRALVQEYRATLRDMPNHKDAPWDGGGPDTPWPAKPELQG